MDSKRLKFRYNGGNIILTIPREFVRHLRLAPGVFCDIYCDEQKIVIDPTTADRSKVYLYPDELQRLDAVGEAA